MVEALTLYTNPMSRGRIVRWMLEEVGAPYRAEVVDYGPPMKAPWYLAMNPMGKVPTLRHGETVITECAAICAYLADAFPDAGMAPPLDRRGAYYRWLFFGAGPVEAVISNRMCGFEVPEDRQPMVGYGNYDLVIDTLEQAVSGEGYITGDRFTAADVYIGSHIGWGMQVGTIAERPAFTAYWDRLKDRDAARRAAALDDALMPESEQQPEPAA